MANKKQLEQAEMMEVLKGACTVDIAQILINEVQFFMDMRNKFGNKEKLVQETEKRVRDVMWVFADAANKAFPEEEMIPNTGLGLLTDPLARYNFRLIIEKKEAAE